METSFDTTLHEMLADTLSWDEGFFPGASGSANGTIEEFVTSLNSIVVNKYTPSNLFTVTDTQRGIICTTFDITLEFGERVNHSWDHELAIHEGRTMLEFVVNAEHKITSLRTVSSLDHAKQVAAVAAVQEEIADSWSK